MLYCKGQGIYKLKKAVAGMARNLSLRELALSELGDFADYVPEEDIQKKMEEIRQRGDREATAAARAFGETYAALRGRAAGWGDEDHADIKNITKVVEDIKRDVNATGKKKDKAKATITPEKKAHFEGLIAAEKERAAKAKEQKPEEKRKQGRPRKHESGGQISVWFDDKMKAAVNQRALVWHCSFSDAVNRLLMLAIKGHM